MFLAIMDVEQCFYSIRHDDINCSVYYLTVNGYLYIIGTPSLTLFWSGIVRYIISPALWSLEVPRQSSFLSPMFFRVFISDLIKNLKSCKSGIHIGDVLHHCFTYTGDVSLFSSTIPGLQIVIDICADYASKWRSTFDIHKSLCMSVSYKPDTFEAASLTAGWYWLKNCW